MTRAVMYDLGIRCTPPGVTKNEGVELAPSCSPSLERLEQRCGTVSRCALRVLDRRRSAEA